MLFNAVTSDHLKKSDCWLHETNIAQQNCKHISLCNSENNETNYWFIEQQPTLTTNTLDTRYNSVIVQFFTNNCNHFKLLVEP